MKVIGVSATSSRRGSVVKKADAFTLRHIGLLPTLTLTTYLNPFLLPSRPRDLRGVLNRADPEAHHKGTLLPEAQREFAGQPGEVVQEQCSRG